MWNDPIVEEVRNTRGAHAKKFKYDLRAIAADLRRRQKAAQRNVVTLSPKKPIVLPKIKSNKVG